MDTRIQEQIEIIKNSILDTVPVEQLFLFGSYAYGTPGKDSDLDFYVVMKDEAPYRVGEALDMIGMALHGKKSIPVDVILAKKRRLLYRLGAPTLEREVKQKGVLLYGSI